MDFVLQKAPAGAALEQGTLLHDRYRILTISGMDESSITYEADDNGSRVAVREFFPMAIASRSGTELVYNDDDGMAFRDGNRAFYKISKALRKGLPHFAPVTEVFSENNTIYAVTSLPEERQLRALSITPTYVQSLGIALCESYAAMHEQKLYYGILREEHLHFSEDGRMYLDPEPIRTDGTAAEDLHCLTAFLSALLPEENDETSLLLQKALQYRYQDALSLKAALMGEKIAAAGNRTGILCLLLCLFFLAAGVYILRQIPEKEVSLSGGLESGKIAPEVIAVWLPLDDNADEASVCAMYERLAAGFERHNPGCGVNIRIYADNSFGDALALLEESEETPAVFMDIRPDEAVNAADLSTLTAALEDVYLTDLSRFGAFIPLGCSVPALFYNEHWSTPETGSLAFSELPADTLYDESAAEYVSRQNPEQNTAAYFDSFLTDGKTPVLASSSCMAAAERSGISSGAVHMIPMTAADGFPLQYEMYCAINRDSDTNSQRVGMLWLHYLLTEEAQQVLFVEHYGDLPLHSAAFDSAVAAHSELAVLAVSAPEASPSDTEVSE